MWVKGQKIRYVRTIVAKVHEKSPGLHPIHCSAERFRKTGCAKRTQLNIENSRQFFNSNLRVKKFLFDFLGRD
jgi:hypothetical protein